MKLKGLTKLALSGVALAAVAATLGTSTYAWYVSNSKAEINNISGQSNTQAAGSLLINKLKSATNLTADPQTWTNKIEYDTLIYKKSTDLDPVTRDMTYTTGGTKTGFHKVDGTAVAVTDAVGYFMVGIKTTDNAKRTVNMRLGIKNDSAVTGDDVDVKPQTAYYAASGVTPTGVEAGGQFYEDFVYALKFDFYTAEILTGDDAKPAINYLTNGTETTADNVTTVTARDAYNAETFKNFGQTGAYTALSGAKTDGDAHAYYKHLSEDYVTDDAIVGGEADNGKTFGTQQSFTLADSTKEYVLIVRYWLDGADAQCFDSCISQKFMLSIKLETTTTV